MEKIKTKKEYHNFYLKKAYKNFWNNEWIPGRDAQAWTEIIMKDRRYIKGSAIVLVKKALTKFELDNQITSEQKQDLEQMLHSPDEENVYVAMSIMAQLRPRSFGRRKNKRKRKLVA